MLYDLVILGGGPAGAAAAVYAARKKIKAAIITESFGGQSIVSTDVQNWIGTKSISGLDLAKNLEEHVKAQEDLEVVEGDKVTNVSKENSTFKVGTQNGGLLEAKTVLVTTGSRRKRLKVPGEDRLDGKGVVYCSTCDAPLFKNKVVAVIGGGNAGLEAVVDLQKYASKIYLVEYGSSIKGDPVTFEKVKTDPKVEVRLNTKTTEILGDKFVSGIKYSDTRDNSSGELKLDGIFVEIGAVPNTEFIRNLVELNEYGEIVVDHKTQRTSMLGVWAAGDASDVLYKQNNISAGDAVKAVLNIYDYLGKQ